MPDVRDGLDAFLLGCFLFGLLLTVGFFAFGGDVDGGHPGDSPLPFGIGALLVAVTWFGGIAYLLRWSTGWPFPISLMVAGVVSVGAGLVVQRVVRGLGRVSGQQLDSTAYRLPGTLGHVAVSIRAEGVGEVIYEQDGVRQVMAARSTTGLAIERGTEVVLLGVERGTALVAPFASLLNEDLAALDGTAERQLIRPEEQLRQD